MAMVNAYKCLLFVFVMNLLTFESCNGQNHQKVKNSNNIGIPILKRSFDSLVGKSVSLLEGKTETIDRDDFITMIRLYNTITVLHLSDKKYTQFINLFVPDNLGKAAKVINATISKGMSYYSKEFDLYIGGKPHHNSQFCITTEL